MTTIFGETTQLHALMRMAARESDEDPKLAQAFVDIGLMQAGGAGIRPRTTNRRVEVAAQKLVAKWMKLARRRIEEQMAAGSLDLAPPPGVLELVGHNIEPESPEVPRESVERISAICCKMLNENGLVPPMFCVLDRDGRGAMMWPSAPFSGREELSQFYQTAEQAGRRHVPDACRFIRCNEAWSAPHDSPVRPSKSGQRQEVVLIMLWDEDEGIDGEASMIAIERDASGKAYGGRIDIACAQGRTTNMDRIYGAEEAPN